MSRAEHTDQLARDYGLTRWVTAHRVALNLRPCQQCGQERWADLSCPCGDLPALLKLAPVSRPTPEIP